MEHDSILEMAASNIRFGRGATREVGMDLADMGLKNVLVVTDPTVAKLPVCITVCEALEKENIQYSLFDRTCIEPTDQSLREAIRFAQSRPFDGYVAVGGGSAMDTAKCANLYATYPADFLDYVNAPVGKDKPVPGPLRPLIAIPTTAGTGSEATGRIVFDLIELRAKTGISSRRIRPTLAVIDPDNTKTMPPQLAAASGADVLTHAIESYTAIPFDTRPRPERPALRPAYQGSNPISDVWALEALRLAAQHLVTAVEDPANEAARAGMLLAAAYAGMGFGNAGCHLAHAMSYPVSGMVRDFRPAQYEVDHPLIPHGMAVILNAPAAFRFTAAACPERHLHAAEVIGADVSGAALAEAGEVLAGRLIYFMRRLNMPNGLSEIGYNRSDIPAMVDRVLPQPRLTKLSPRPAGREDLQRLFEDAMVYW